MRRVTVTDLKNRLNEFLRLVKRGETLEVVERSVPIARVSAVRAGNGSKDDLLERLVREGVVTRAAKAPDRRLLDLPPVPCAIDPVEILIEQRGDR